MAENKTPEFEPPQACVQRVIKAVLPDNVQIGKDAKAAFSRSAGIFIMYLTACANDFCREAKRQTISAQDVMQAIKELEFGELEEPLREYLDQYRREASAKKQSKAMGAGAGAVAKKGETGDIDEAEAEGDQGVGGEAEAEEGIGDDADGGYREREGGGDDAQQNSSNANASSATGTNSNAGGANNADSVKMAASGSQAGPGGVVPMEEDGHQATAVVSAGAPPGTATHQDVAGGESIAG